MIDLVILLFTAVILVILGLLVFLRNTHDITHKLFGIMTIAGILWGSVNYLTNHVYGHQAQLITPKLSLFIGFLLIQSVWLLSIYFPRKISVHKTQRLISVISTIVLLELTLFTDYVVSGVVYDPAKKITDISTGKFYYLYVAAAGIFFIFIVNNFIRTYNFKGITRIQRQQILYAATGLLLAFLWAILTAAVIPSITHNWVIAKFGPVGTLFPAAFISFSIIRHRLFDIRLIVARSIAYLTSLVVVASIYGFLVFGTADLIFRLRFSIAVQIFISAATAVASLSFANVKRFFDRVTNRLFFRDSYDTQVFFDEFNKALVVTYELDQLLKESVKIIEQNIKPVHCQFVINKTPTTEGRIMGTANKPALDEDDLKAINEAVSKTQQKLIVADELEARHEALQKRLRAKNIVVAAALSSSSSGAKSEVGYLLLGPKKSGNLYSSQDVKVIEIVANELVIAVQNALRFEEIESFNITLQGKVDEATRKLRRANERLRTLDETKDDFISMASHQLRTPLTSVKGYISMVLEGDAGKISPTQKKLLTQSFFSSQRMVYLIADLLNVSRLRTGKFVIDQTPVNLAEVVEQELEQLKETAASHSLKLTYQKPKHFPELMLDETKTRQVIMNFVDNAIYYTPSGGHIDVRLIDNPTSVELRVEDNGIGVPVSEKPHMFTKFYRAGNARKARPDGTGLGLFMAKKVIVAQGGSIIFESQEGKGSTFGFIFSKAKHAVPAASKPKSQTPPAAVKS
jgi:signal transduction histidine kinase